MRNVLDKRFRENQNTHFMFNKIIFFENRTICEIMWQNIVQPDRTNRWRYGSCVLHAGYPGIQTHIWNMKYLLLFYYNNGYTKASQCCVTQTLHISLLNRLGENLQYDLWILKTVQLTW